MSQKIDAVFEGGGVKGIGLAGAVATAERLGYQFENVAGTSAGAIVAALIAAGYTAAELKEAVEALDFKAIQDVDAVDKIPLIGKALSVFLEKGLFEGKFFEHWMQERLAAKNVRTFGDLVIPAYAQESRYRYRLQVIATDITRRRLVVLPRDAALYGIDPDALPVAQAVRMSMSIPIFFEPVELRNAAQRYYIVDGGVLSNFPVWLFDAETADPAWPTLGFKLVDPGEGEPTPIAHGVDLVKALVSTMLEAHDARYIEEQDFVRTIPIPTVGVGTTEFSLSNEKRDALYQSGVHAAEEFFANWDFERYKRKYRVQAVPGRQAQAWGEAAVTGAG